MRLLAVLLVAMGCGGGTDSDTEVVRDGRCGAVTEHSMSIDVTVTGGDGQPVDGATVRLEERAWEPGTLGQATTDGSGRAQLADLTITGVQDCWGVVLDYQLVVELDDRSVQDALNSPLFNAVQSGETTLSRDVTLP